MEKNQLYVITLKYLKFFCSFHSPYLHKMWQYLRMATLTRQMKTNARKDDKLIDM